MICKENISWTDMNKTLLYVLLTISIISIPVKSKTDLEVEDCRKLIPEDYRKHRPPPSVVSGVPVNVYATLLVMDLDEINEGRMDFRLHTYLTVSWNDSRLVSGITSAAGYPLDSCYKYIWTPDVNFESAKKVETFGSRHTYFYVLKDGSLYMTDRYTFIVGCRMSFRLYPFDTQICLFSIAFMSTADTEAVLRWIDDENSPYKEKRRAISMLKNIEPLQFYLVQPAIYREEIEFYLENFTYLMVNFTFVRRVTGSIVSIYAPSALIVAVSMVTFWIRVDAAPARVALSITSLLTLCTQGTQYKSQLPPVNYITAMDIWLFACILTVFSTLVEFAVSYNMYTKTKQGNINQPNAPLTSDSPSVQEDEQKRKAWLTTACQTPHQSKLKDNSSQLHCVNSIDVFCRKFYPPLYIAFMMIYWIYFMNS